MNITEFLLARIAEDEAVAKAASPGPWIWEGDASEDESFLYGPNGSSILSAYGMHSQGFLERSEGDADQIARHDPARVLAECTAKRAILLEHPMTMTHWWPEMVETDVCETCGDGVTVEWPCPTIAALSAVYTDHPDYQQEWAE
ncbi:MAG: DUF6221 family protein [Actinomycetota bacterium]|nr:DUF6221 family protein [Actinomycetota bacterium]